MSYIEDVCLPLIRVLERNNTLQTHQLAGQTANVEFWLAEVRHAIALIDGYQERFKRLKQAQLDYDRDHPRTRMDWEGYSEEVRDPPLKQGTPDSERKQLRKRLLDAARGLLDRIEREQLLSPDAVDSLRVQLTAST